MLESQIEIVDQAIGFLSETTDDEYIKVCTPHISSSTGMHMRHVLDHYSAVIEGMSDQRVNYNKRNRFCELEKDRSRAIEYWQKIRQWLQTLSQEQLDLPLEIQSEIAIESQRNACVPSSLCRELLFVSSHAIHHFSLMSVSRSLQNRPTDTRFGVAPATLSFNRQRA